MKLVAYCRVSSLSQEDNSSLQHQEDRIRKYCEYHGHELVVVLKEAKSGKNTERKQYQQMLDMLPDVDGVIAFKLDRISRSVKDLLILVEDVLKPANKALVLVDNEIDTTKPQGMFFLTMIGAMAEMERHTIRERCKSGIDKAKAEGRHIGGGENRYGYCYDILAKKVIKHPGEQENIAKMLHLYEVQGLTYSQIADVLNDLEIPSKQGSTWTKGKVSTIFNALEVKPVRAGVKLKRVIDKSQPRRHGFRFIDPAIKNRIYELRLLGNNLGQVAIALNAEGYCSKKGGAFRASTVSRIIAANKDELMVSVA